MDIARCGGLAPFDDVQDVAAFALQVFAKRPHHDPAPGTQCLRNVEAILRAAGSALDKAVSATFILAEESDFAGMNEEWNKWFAVDPPARQGAKLPIRPKGMKISIAVIAEA